MKHLFFGGADVVRLVKKYGSPLYITDEEKLRENFKNLSSAFPEADIFYASKANNNPAILKILRDLGAGADVFSGGELFLCLSAGVNPSKILFNGNSKTDEELKMAVQKQVKISVDSFDELRALSKIAKKMGKTAEIAFRVNPDINPKTHSKIATGLKTAKFGIPHKEIIAAYKESLILPNINPSGIHCHIGSQILVAEPFCEMALKMMDLAEKILKLGVNLKFMDFGGGLGISYERKSKYLSFKDWANAIIPIFNKGCRKLGINPKLILEPGRSLVGNTTILVAKVNIVKRAYKNFVGIDAGFNLLIRPAFYGSRHEVIVANKIGEKAREIYTIVGPICETGDILAKDRILPKVEKDDLIAIFDTGAYGYSMSSQYNGRPRCAEILVSRGKSKIIRNAETYQDLWPQVFVKEG